MCLCLSVCLCQCVCVSVCLSVSLSVSLSVCLPISLSLSLSLSIVMLDFEPLYKRKKGEKNDLFIYLFNYLFCSVWRPFWPACAYAWARMVRSGLLLLTRGRWNAVRCYGIQFVYQ